MKLGMIFECGPAGADLQVCTHLASRLRPGIEISHATLDNKKKLMAECGAVAARLIADGCRRVLIIWDLFPAWRARGFKPCRREDRQAIFASLRNSLVRTNQVDLICIEEELECWLLADGRALSEVLSTSAHRVRAQHMRKPHTIRSPKTRLNRLFMQHVHYPYVDRQHAIQIVRSLPDLNHLMRVTTFARFASRLQI